ncbi:MAG: ATP-grasp domain-containing protein [Pseudomonadota bacterium]
MGRVLVTDANGRNVVSVVRSLGKHGIDVVAAECEKIALSFFSKYCKERLTYPSPRRNPGEWLAWLLRELQRRPYDMIIPIGDDCTEIVSKHKEQISLYTKVPVADYAIWSCARDKAQTLQLSAQLGLPHPQTRIITDLMQVKIVAEEMSLPLVIKPRESNGSRGIVYVHEKGKLEREYLKIHQLFPYPMIQEFIPTEGKGYGVFLMFNKDGIVRTTFAHRRLREFPVKGGPSTLRESVHRPDLVEIATMLLKALNWYGVAMVEFKEDPRDKQCKIMEINPRFWGSLPLAIAAGVDFPYLLYRMVMDGDIKPVVDYQAGIRCRWLLPGDILHFITNPNRFKLEPSFFDFSKNNRNDDFISWEDMGPTFGFFLIFLKSLFSKKKWKHIFFR